MQIELPETRSGTRRAVRRVILDPFAGAGSTLAAAEAVGYESIGVEEDEHYFGMACAAIPKLAQFHPKGGH
jgi:site-specific DNA-methyltransferase (adenine-specific)